jgi:hypothetical protein
MHVRQGYGIERRFFTLLPAWLTASRCGVELDHRAKKKADPLGRE